MLKIAYYSGTERNYKTVKLEETILIEDAVKTFAGRVGLTPYEDFGLYLHSPEGQQGGRWLRMKSTLRDVAVPSGADLECKKRVRLQRISLIDGTARTIPIDDMWAAEEILRRAVRKFGISEAAIMGLQRMGADEHTWLALDRPLCEQAVAEDAELVLRLRAFSGGEAGGDVPLVHVAYLEARRAVLSGAWSVSSDAATRLAGLALQAEVGNAAGGEPIQLDSVLPAHWRYDGVAGDLSAAWQALAGMADADARQQYLRECAALPMYGTVQFPAKARGRPPGPAVVTDRPRAHRSKASRRGG
jgi:hypothetical protein